MLNYLWAGMILIGIIYGAFQGTMQEMTDVIIEASKEAVSLCLTMIGIMSFWTGIMEVAEKAGVMERMAKFFRPFVQFLFPKIPRSHKANEHITTNIIANMLGLGWAATPAGLRAMEALQELNEERGHDKTVASDEMCTFLILNISSLQLIPMTIIAYRSQYGSVDPAGIVGPGLLATAVSTIAAIIFCKVVQFVGRGKV